MSTPTANFCGQCGGPLKANAQFCGACGRPVVVAAATTPPADFPTPASPTPAVNTVPTAAPPSLLGETHPPSGASGDRKSDGRRWKIVALGALGAIAIGGAVAALVLLTKSNPKTSVVVVHSPTTSLAATSTTTTPSDLARQQAGALNQLLSQSATDRNSIDSATSDIENCGDLAGDQSTLQTAAQSRQTMLNQLSQLEVSQLPNSATIVSTLTSAWQSSLQSDTSYASWAGDLLQSGCVSPASTDDPSWQAAQTSDASATTAKNQFVAEWNLLAATYGLPQYQPDQI